MITPDHQRDTLKDNEEGLHAVMLKDKFFRTHNTIPKRDLHFYVDQANDYGSFKAFSIHKKYWPKLTKTEVSNALAIMKPNKATGTDGVNTKLLKILWEGSNHWRKQLFKMLSKCIAHAYHPLQWRHTTTIAIRKKGRSGTRAKDYRPIAIINIISKLYEGIVNKRMYFFAEENHLLPDNQFGARSGYNSLDGVIQLVHDMKRKRGQGSALILDVQGAYDNVNISKLIDILRQMNFPAQMLSQWVYLRAALLAPSSTFSIQRLS
ncbi:unnamed protein product [Ambrosiozyma monospora]|uniref:Unnamed protein product n=1 Tax=Ambrosiozyma monospora TaxID=43982 RepID=A0A9W7DEJ1_AMBMO|nr:unnamed protein product [Ambrosiozyma monospora]